MIRIGEKPASAGGPIEHLTACHRRIEERLATLERAGEWAASDDEVKKTEARHAIERAMRFLDSSGALHTVDEEESLFPRLMPRMDAPERQYVEALERQHREVDAAYAELKMALARDDAPGYRAAAAKVARLYREHIASEDTSLMTMAQRLLTDTELDEIAVEMKGRRAQDQGR